MNKVVKQLEGQINYGISFTEELQKALGKKDTQLDNIMAEFEKLKNDLDEYKNYMEKQNIKIGYEINEENIKIGYKVKR